MSAYLTLPTPMTDQGCLVQALEDVGVRQSDIEVSSKAIPLNGYNRNRKAHIILRREVTRDPYNDIGFFRSPVGFTAILSDDYGAYGRRWLAKVRAAYDTRWREKQERLAAEERRLKEEAARRRAAEERRRQEEARKRLVEAQRAAVHKKAKKMGYRVKESRQGDTIRLVLIKRSY